MFSAVFIRVSQSRAYHFMHIVFLTLMLLGVPVGFLVNCGLPVSMQMKLVVWPAVSVVAAFELKQHSSLWTFKKDTEKISISERPEAGSKQN